LSKWINLQRDLTLQADEKRYPRDKFTKQLVRICKALDEVSIRDISYDLYGTTATCHLEATELWVVGSYARGALACGDLDVIVSFAATGAGLPMPKVLSRAFFGATPGVRFYSGTPEVNRSGAVFPDAVLIWSIQDCDWQARIDSIMPDPTAGRAARDTDSVPLRAEQMRFPSCTLNDVARWERDGILEWNFVPLDNGLLSAIPPQEIGSKERQLFECITGMGQKTLDLIPAVWRVMRKTEPGASWKAAVSEKATLRCGGTLIHVGAPALDLTHFENAKVRQLMLVPHRTARGPNGMWLIRRGPRHPHMLGLKRCCIFYVGEPGIEAGAHPQQEGGDAGVIEVFDLKADATEALKKMKLNSAKSSQVIQAKGFALYELIIQADAIRYGDDLISFTSYRPSASVKA
jgi:hypothetical protein